MCLITNSYFPDFTGDNAMRCRVHVGADPNAAVVAEQNKENEAVQNRESVDINVEMPADATNNMILDFDNGKKFVETEIPVTITVDRTTGIIKPTDNKGITFYANSVGLYINSPVAETVGIYSITGALLYNASKPAGVIRLPVTIEKSRIVIVKGSSGWVKNFIIIN